MPKPRKPAVFTYPGPKKKVSSGSVQGGSRALPQRRSVVGANSCSICGLTSHSTEACGLIAGGAKVSDAACPPKAILTLPSCVEYQGTGLTGEGDVVCKSKVVKGTQFGPLDAPKGTTFNASCPYMLGAFEDTGQSFFYDTSDKTKCNWMTLVRFSEDEKKINCLCYQLKNDVYFSVLKDVGPRLPLVVGYSKGYMQQLKNLEEQTEQLNRKGSQDLGTNRESVEVLHLKAGEKKDSNSKNYRDHDYIHLNIKAENSRQKAGTEIGLNSTELSTTRAASEQSVGRDNTPVRKSSRQLKLSKKSWQYKSSNEEELKLDLDAQESSNAKDSEKSMKRLKRVQVIRVLEKWICKFCHKAILDIELFTSHLIDHYKSVGWGEGEGCADNEQIYEDSKQTNEPTSPYTCDICLNPKEFNKLEFIIRHLTNHLAGLTKSQESKEDALKSERDCQLCMKSFFSVTRLQSHVDVNHGKLARCKRCRRNFSSDEELKFHACRHFKCETTNGDVAVLLKCEVCEETFSKSSLFEKHAVSHDPITFTCPICFKSLTNDTRKLHCNLCFTVQNFLNLNSEDLLCPCLKCEKTFRTMEHFQEHVAAHTHPLMCQSCRMRFRTTDDVQQHLCTGIVCDGCDKSFGNLDYLVSHIKSYHQGPVAYCFECVVPFASKEGYDNHGDCEYQHDLWLKQVETPAPTTEAGRYICEMCGATYNNWSSMKTHRKTHGPRKYACDQCGKSFHRKELLTDHINVHDDAKFKCESCYKMFKSKKSLEVHMRIHNGVKPYSCSTCGRAFTQRVNLRAHAVTHLPEDQKGFQCPYEDCEKKFATKEYLKFHMEIHGQGTSIACDVCGKQFYRMHILNRHKRTAHGNHKYKCEFCIPPLYLRQKHNLFRHLQRLHDNFKEEWSQDGYANKVFIPGDGNFSHPSVKSRMSKMLQPMLPSSSSSIKPEETVLRLQEDGTGILNQDEGMTVMLSGSIEDAEGEIEIQPEEVIIEQDHGSEIQILGLPETADGQTSMVLLQLDNSGNYVIAFPTHVSESVQLIEELE